MGSDKMGACAVCENTIPLRPYQAPTARACGPVCASALARREHPEWFGRHAEIESTPDIEAQPEPQLN